MCIIAYSPAGVEMPEEKEIRRMFDKNPDGAGFAIQGYFGKSFEIHYTKGLMSVDDLLKELGDLKKLKEYTVVLHCRIKTHGKVDKHTTHPFVIDNNYGNLRKLTGVIKKSDKTGLLFHNGTFSGLGGLIDENASDTQDFVAGVATKYLKQSKMPGKVATKILNTIIGYSRVLVLYPDPKFPVLRFGSWEENEGRYYSNAGYKEVKPTTYSSASYCGGNWTYGGTHYSYNSKTDPLYDDFGAAIYESAVPSSVNTYIVCQSLDRFESLKDKTKVYSEDETDEGLHEAEFEYTKGKWYFDEYSLEIFREDKMDIWEDKRELEMLEEEYGMYEDDGIVDFTDAEDMANWVSYTRPEGKYSVKAGKNIYYMDIENLRAYTLDALKSEFGINNSGHVKKLLEKNGTLKGSKYEEELELTEQAVLEGI